MVTGSFWFIRDAILVGFITKYGSQQAINSSADCGLLLVAMDALLFVISFLRPILQKLSSGKNQSDPIASFQVLLRVEWRLE